MWAGTTDKANLGSKDPFVNMPFERCPKDNIRARSIGGDQGRKGVWQRLERDYSLFSWLASAHLMRFQKILSDDKKVLK